MDKKIAVAGLCLMMAHLASSSVLMCYVTSWSQYRNGEGQFISDNLDANLCTHLVFAFANMENNELTYESTQDTSYYNDLSDLKLINPNLKTLLALGGSNFPSWKFQNMAATSGNRDTFIQSTISFLRYYDFDGINLDWEFPSVADKDRFTALCQETLQAFEAEVAGTSTPRLLLIAAVPSYMGNMAGYDIPQISMYLDYMNVMSYDFYSLADGFTRHHSPLYAGPSDFGNHLFFTSNYSMSTWRDSGAPAEKLLMGIAAYGRTFTLTSATNNGVAAPTSGVGEPGLYTGEGGFWSYYEVCYNVPLQDRHWSEGQEVPYGSAGTTWVGFDNPDSVEAKANVIKTYNYGGAAVWAVDLDDFSGEFCNQGPYPLTTRLHKLLVTDSESSTTTTTAADNTGQTTTTAADNTGQTTTTAADNTGQTTATAADNTASSSVLMCYVTSWSQYRNGEGQFISDNIDANLCTHLVFAFANMENNELTYAVTQDTSYYNDLSDLKLINPNLKTLLALGGSNFPSWKFPNMAATSGNRDTFIQSTISFLRYYDFDGINLDWEFPSVADRDRFTALCQETLQAFEAEVAGTSTPRLLLTAAVPSYMGNMAGYDIPQISMYLDYMNVMSYDFYSLADGFTRHHSPLFAGPSDFGNHLFFTSNYSMSTWRDSGAPAEKLLMGIAAYGRTFTLTSATNNGVAAPTSGVGEPGLYTGEGGFWSYYEVCYNVPLQDRHWSEGQEVPYGSAGTTWVGFDNPDSVEAKANVIKTYNYGGAAVWAVDLDDFRGEFCNQGPYPLTTRLHELLVTDSESSTTTAADNTGQTTTTAADNTGQTTTTAADNTGPTTTTAADNTGQTTTTAAATTGPTTTTTITTTTTTTTTTESLINTNFCMDKYNGYYAVVGVPTSFYQCHNSYTYVKNCPSGLVWGTFCTCCTWSWLVWY